MAGVRPRDGVWIGIAGLDLVRDDARRVARARGQRAHAERHRLLGRGARGGAAPARRPRRAARRSTASRPRCAASSATAAWSCSPTGPATPPTGSTTGSPRQLGLALVTPADLELRGDRLLHDGEPVDGVYRRTNADEVDSEVGALLTPALRAGSIKLTNCFGTGIGDDKLAHAYVEDMIRFYLGEEPLLARSRRSTSASRDTLERALDVFDELVIKDRGSYGGLGVVICPHAERADVEELRERVRAAPADFVAQRLVELSTHPTVIDGKLRPRHVDLRPFVLMSAPDTVEVTARRRDARRARRGRAGRQLLPERRREGHLGAAVTALPRWAEWNPEAAAAPWTVGVEEEVMLLDPQRLVAGVARRRGAPRAARRRSPTRPRAETHGSALELASQPHPTVGAAIGELASLRAGLAAGLAPLELRAAVCGTHPFAQWRRGRGLAGRALPLDLRLDARARAARADVRAARPRRGARRRVGGARAARAARARPAAARARGQLPLLAGPRHRPRRRPACRSSARSRASASRASSPTTPSTSRRSTCCCAATRSPSRRTSGGTCGCSPSSARSRCGSWTPRRASATTPRWRRSCSARCGWRRRRATSTRRSRRGPRCSRRTASSRRATGCGRSSSIPSTTRAGRRARSSASCSPHARPHAAALGCKAELAGGRGARRRAGRPSPAAAGRGAAGRAGRPRAGAARGRARRGVHRWRAARRASISCGFCAYPLTR